MVCNIITPIALSKSSPTYMYAAYRSELMYNFFVANLLGGLVVPKALEVSGNHAVDQEASFGSMRKEGIARFPPRTITP